MIGSKFDTNCGECVVIEYHSSTNVIVQFGTGSKVACSTSNLRKGRVLDPFFPKVRGLGYKGVGEFNSIRNRRLHQVWTHMFERCFTHPSYIDCTIVKRWHNFQVFCADVVKMANWDVTGFEFDKDLRVLGSKKYGPKTCSFVPHEINCLLIRTNGVHQYKGKWRVSVADKLIGTFATKEKALAVYLEAKRKHIMEVVKRHEINLHPQVRRNLLSW